MCKMKICIVATNGKSLVDFRGQLISTLANQGYEVTCVSIEPEAEMAKQIQALGAKYVQISGDRVSVGILSGFKMIGDYKRLFKTLKPDICFLYMSKPIAFGGYAAVSQHIKHINILVNGLENAYYRNGIKDFAVRQVMSFFYRYVAKHADNVFMQNHDDYKYFIEHHIATDKNMTVVNGSGVDMSHYVKSELPEKPVFLMVARLLWSKGIREYLSAIPIVKKECPEARFMLVGGLDHNDEALSEEELNKWIEEYSIEYCGQTNDVYPFLKQCSVFVLPSYHEGTPRSVLEAMSVGRAIITTDAPGCRETVVDGKNGYLVPVGDSLTLAEKMKKLALDSKLREGMAEESYLLCKDKFEVNKVNTGMINAMLNKH